MKERTQEEDMLTDKEQETLNKAGKIRTPNNNTGKETQRQRREGALDKTQEKMMTEGT